MAGTPFAVGAHRVRPVARPNLQAVAAVRSPEERRRLNHLRIRKKVSGTTERPRLSVFRSNQHIYVQVIDDTQQCTLAAASTVQKDVSAKLETNGANVEAATLVGKKIAEVCAERGISKVCFDRGGYKYHGRVKAIAEAAREGGLDF
eukprot:TRINITY_DN13630_c0_g1_i1.p3 TRINITY_DN13630_c0_g1~~TRINITY_DN13630_c0_g1_i1.p3  ORF type:complete len:169 (-),score=17.00 TRINITY_DN13630_c0_g1_i1:342-782(-)